MPSANAIFLQPRVGTVVIQPLQPTENDFANAARAVGLEISVRSYPEGTRTAADAARAIGCQVGQIVKSLVFIVDGKPVMALVSGANQLDEKLLAKAVSGSEVRRANADEVRSATGYPIGGVPPIDHDLPVFMDQDLLRHDEVWAAAGTPREVFGVAPQALLTAVEGVVVPLRADP
jgi:prolyl-tRNA editing enzyme YbaK/EbsC (Cys-tRNA(Pro) deacylase)